MEITIYHTADVPISGTGPPPADPFASLKPGTFRAVGNWAANDSPSRSDYSCIVYDPKRKQWLFPLGGGHGIFNPTNIRAFPKATLKWVDLYRNMTNEEQAASTLDPLGFYTNTLQPKGGEHTYNGLAVDGDRLQVLTSYATTAPHWYDLANGGWHYEGDATFRNVGGTQFNARGGDGRPGVPYMFPWTYVVGCCPTQDGRDLIAGQDGSFFGAPWLWDPATKRGDQLKQVGAFGIIAAQPPVLLHYPPNGLYYCITQGTQVPDVIRVFEMAFNAASPKDSVVTEITSQMTGPTPTLKGRNSYDRLSLSYDPVNKNIGGCVADGFYHAFKPETREWRRTALVAEAGTTGLPNQVFNCCARDPESNVLLVLNDVPLMGYIVRPPAWTPDATGQGTDTKSLRVQMTDAPTNNTGEDGPNWYSANRRLKVDWKNPGGDWRDKNDIAQGTAHYAVVDVDGFDQHDITFDVAALVTRLLSENTGFYLNIARGLFKIAQGRLHVVTTTGTFDPPCIVDTYLDVSSNQPQGSVGELGFPAIFKFDLAGVTGNVTSAVLTVKMVRGYILPGTIVVDYLDSPALNITADGAVLGKRIEGIAAGVSSDNKLANHPSVLIYDDLVSKDYITSRFEGISPNRPDVANDVQIIDWPQYGLKAARCWTGSNAGIINPRILQWHHWGQPVSGFPWQVPFGQGETHLFFRILIEIGTDLMAGFTEGGMKMPGLAGSYEWGNTPAIFQQHCFSARMWHSPVSRAHPHIYHVGNYLYAYGGTPLGGGAFADEPMSSLCVKAGKVYSWEQELKLNTIVGGVPQNDGEMRIWIDGVLGYELTGFAFRGPDDKVRIQDMPFLNIYHGGTLSPSSDFHIDIGGIVIATEYVGPPKVIA